MQNSNNKSSSGFFSNALGVAKKLSEVGLNAVNQVVPKNEVSVDTASHNKSAIEGSARQKGLFEANKYENPQQMLRAHVPQVSQQLFGRHYGKLNRVANFVSPQFSDKISDYLFDQLNTFTNNISSVDAVLDEAGVRDLEELTQDVSRSKRISQALAEQNKWIATVQGALTGATGVVGSTIDIPVSIVMSLRTIYQVGHSYGFELNEESEQDIVQYIFKQIDLGVIAEKQAVLMGLKAISNMLQTHDVYQLQQLIGSSNDIDVLKKWISTENGEAKWDWLNHIPKFSLLSKLTPVAASSISAIYSWKLIDEVNTKAQEVFSQAREYLLEHKNLALSPIAAYEKSVELLAKAAPKLLDTVHHPLADPLNLDEEVVIKDHETISKVQIKKKSDVDGESENHSEEEIQKGIDHLAEKMVSESDPVDKQKPALNNTLDSLDIAEFEVEESKPSQDNKE